MELEVNSVQNLLKNRPTFDEKLLIKKKGRPTPDLQINYSSESKTRTYNRAFNKTIYDKYEWMCGCPVKNKLFCFFCLILKKDVDVWTKQGCDDLKHLAARAKKHENSIAHINASMDFNVLGKVNIREQLKSAFLKHKLKCNEEVEKNRHILRRLIMCIKFYGAFELALRGHDEKSSENPGLYMGLINFAAELDSVLAIHMRDAKVFKVNGVSTNIQNELLDAMLEIYKQEVLKEIKFAKFIALEADETTDACNQQQLVVIVRYVSNGQKICERFWSFIKPEGYTHDQLSKALLDELQVMLDSPHDNLKLIAQSYDGASVMSDETNGVQAIIKRKFPHAHFIHCYAHQFYLLVERAAHCHKRVKIFFANLQSFSSFFSRSPKRITILDDVVKQRLPQAAPTRWNFESRTANTLFEHQDIFKDCLERIIDEDGMDSKTISESSGLLKHLSCPEFLYWLKLFHFIMPHVEIFFNQAQTLESPQMEKAVEHFQNQIFRIRSSTVINGDSEIHDEEPASKRHKTEQDNQIVIANEVCDAILSQIKDRFDFKDHLSATKLFASQNFKSYRPVFPKKYFDATVNAYPMLDSVKLKSELCAIYERDDMCSIDGILPLLVFISENNLEKVLTETYKLLDIICTTPMSTSECERCFSTLKRIKTFLRSTMSEDRLNALAVLSIEKKFVQSIPDFDNKVIEAFCRKKNRRMDFMFK